MGSGLQVGGNSGIITLVGCTGERFERMDMNRFGLGFGVQYSAFVREMLRTFCGRTLSETTAAA
jgi:hypothetical protein